VPPSGRTAASQVDEKRVQSVCLAADWVGDVDVQGPPDVGVAIGVLCLQCEFCRYAARVDAPE
jgi:hypothetical protein